MRPARHRLRPRADRGRDVDGASDHRRARTDPAPRRHAVAVEPVDRRAGARRDVGDRRGARCSRAVHADRSRGPRSRARVLRRGRVPLGPGAHGRGAPAAGRLGRHVLGSEPPRPGSAELRRTRPAGHGRAQLHRPAVPPGGGAQHRGRRRSRPRVVAAGTGFGVTSRRADPSVHRAGSAPGPMPPRCCAARLRPAEPWRRRRPPSSSCTARSPRRLHGRDGPADPGDVVVHAPPARPHPLRSGVLLRYIGVALDVDEVELFDDFIAWLADVLTSRHVPRSVLGVSLDVLATVLERAGQAAPATVCGLAEQRLQVA